MTSELTRGKRYVVEFKASIFAYVEYDDDNEPTVTKVVADDENLSAAVHVEYDDGSDVDDPKERDAVTEDEKPLEWPAWEHGW